MGSGASSEAADKLSKASVDEVSQALATLSNERREKILQACEEGESTMDLGFVLDELFRCFDADQDGQIEREEFLACWEKLSDILDESFGPKQRKVKMQWLRDAGAVGTPTEGMYLSKEKWRDAFLATASIESGIPATEQSKIATWMWKSYAESLVEKCFPGEKPVAPPVELDVPSGPRPEYPMKIPLKDMVNRLEEANAWGLRPLVLANTCSEVGTFFKYKIPGNLTLDANSLFLKKAEEKKNFLKQGMEYEGLCAPVLIQLGSGAPDINKAVCNEFPAEIFDASAWTPKVAFENGFITETMLTKLESDAQKWKAFDLIIHSDLGLDDATTKLKDKIPYFEKLAIIVIDPDSVA